MTDAIVIIFLILVIGGLIAVFMLFLRHDAPYAHSNAFGRHLNFDHYHMDTIIKVLYFFTIIVNTVIAFAIMAYTAQNTSGDGSDALVIVMLGLLVFAALQFLSRMVHEAIIMYVNIAQDVRGIRDACGYNRVPARVSVTPVVEQQNAAPKPSLGERASALRETASRVASAVATGLASDHNEEPAVAPIVPEKASVQVNQEQPWVCDTCGTLVYSGKFCPKCGSPRPQMSDSYQYRIA